MKKRSSIRSDTSTTPAGVEEVNLAAWEANPQGQALRTDLHNGTFFIFPYSHFVYAHFSSDERGETLRICFTAHEVVVSGRHLRELGIALQKFSVEWIREVPARYAALAERGNAFVERINITETDLEESAQE